MKSNELKKVIKKEVSSGKTKTEIFAYMTEGNTNPEYHSMIEELIASCQNTKASKLFALINYSFFVLMLMIAAFSVYSKAYIAAVYFVLLAYIVFFRKLKYYVWVSVLGTAFFLSLTLGSFYGFMEKEPLGLSPLLLSIFLIISLVFILFGFMMPRFLKSSDRTSNTGK